MESFTFVFSSYSLLLPFSHAFSAVLKTMVSADEHI